MKAELCEVCGNQAVKRIQDVREVKSRSGARRWEKDGPVHFYCCEHTREFVATYLDGGDDES